MASHRQPIPDTAREMYGVSLEDPRQGNEPLAFHIKCICPAVMALIQEYHHPGRDGFEIQACHIGPPRGKHGGIARIELIYRRESRSWRQVFAVTDSTEHGLRLWTEVRRYVRQS